MEHFFGYEYGSVGRIFSRGGRLQTRSVVRMLLKSSKYEAKCLNESLAQRMLDSLASTSNHKAQPTSYLACNIRNF